MQKNYRYVLTCSPGKNIQNKDYPDFRPYYTPLTMLKMGIFEGKYMTDCHGEFPANWYSNKVKMTKTGKPDINLNYFKVKSRLSLHEWRKRKWLPVHKKDKDVRGWFQWYCRYWMGRRIPEVDIIQINRWRSFKRHYAQVLKYAKTQPNKRTKQRQALLQWAWKCDI
jgi:hypothetical protein